MARDALLTVSGPLGAPGNAIEAATVTADADATKGYVYVGKYMMGFAECRIAGAFDRTTGNETLSFEVWEATDAAGTSAALIASSAALTATHAAVIDETSQYGKTTPALSDGPTRVGWQTGAGGWLKGVYNVAGTTPIATSVSMFMVPTSGAYRASGT